MTSSEVGTSQKTALIVGAKRVGRVVARRLARDGMNLAIVYRSSVADALDLQYQLGMDDELPAVNTALIQADLSDEHQVERAVDQTVEELGGLHYVVNLASDYPYSPFAELDESNWDRAMSTAKGSFLLGIHAVKRMRQNPGPNRGHIIFFGDWAAEATPYTDYLPYLTSKAAIHFMTRCMAAEVAPLGIRVNAIAPGPTMRPPDITPEVWDSDIAAKAPLKQESNPDDIANVIATLLETSSITGEVIRVDSGRHIRGV